MSRPRILVTNDDGIFSEGIERLAAALAPVGEVFTVAPDQERSAAGHSLTLQSPLRAKLVGLNRWSVDGTPTDCVNWGVLHLLKDERPKLIFSGINLGLNLGDDVTYSGTVSPRSRGRSSGFPPSRSRRRLKRDSPSMPRRHLPSGWRGGSWNTRCRPARSGISTSRRARRRGFGSRGSASAVTARPSSRRPTRAAVPTSGSAQPFRPGTPKKEPTSARSRKNTFP